MYVLTNFEQIADGFLREAFPEGIAHERGLAFCR